MGNVNQMGILIRGKPTWPHKAPQREPYTVYPSSIAPLILTWHVSCMSIDIRPLGDLGMDIAKHLININVDSVNIPDVPQICSTGWNDSHLK